MSTLARQNGSVKAERPGAPAVDQVLADLEYIPTPQDLQDAAEAHAPSDLTAGDKGRSFPELIQRWADLFAQSDDDPRYEWLSERLAQLAKDARTLGAATPHQFNE